MTKPLSGRIALVTGASSGLGQHFTGVLAKAGAKAWRIYDNGQVAPWS